MIPGSNLLNSALSIIAKQTIIYYKAASRTKNALKQWIVVYDTPVNIVGSFQPVPRSRYDQYGLDFQKSYFTFYTSNDLIDIQRNVAADQIVFGSQRYQCLSSNDWFGIDGWLGILCVLIEGAAD